MRCVVVDAHQTEGRPIHPMNTFLEPGQLVKNPAQVSWGAGQIQSIIGDRITVNFENVGKVVINGSEVVLEEISE